MPEAILKDGPADGKRQPVADPPPRHLDVEVRIDIDPVEIPAGGEYPEAVFETHRYVLSNYDADPKATEPRATYSWQGRRP